MTQVFDGEWWFLSLPLNWAAKRDADDVTFTANPRIGTIQISAALKESADVSDDDLREFAGDGIHLTGVSIGRLKGLMRKREEGGLSWSEWWMRDGRVMLYITYIVPTADDGKEERDVQAILESLTVKPSVST